jgi:DNA-binding phage protein
MGAKRTKLSDQLRRAIKTSGKTRYRIWRETGIAQETLSRFVSGKGGLSIDGIDKLGECLGLNLVPHETKSKGR